MSSVLNRDAFPAVEVDYACAMAYLRREAVVMPEGTPRGYVVPDLLRPAAGIRQESRVEGQQSVPPVVARSVNPYSRYSARTAQAMTSIAGRFAPSPTGRMHLGNVFTALLSWLSARKAGGRWILRIEDLDPQRSRIEHARMIEDDLDWLGLDWDEGGLADTGPHGPYRQESPR